MSKYLAKNFQRDYWNNNSNARDYKHPIVQFFVQQRMDYLKKYLDFSKINSAFDVGCGDGFSTYFFDQIIDNVEGGDVAEELLKLNPVDDSKLRVIDAQNMPEIPDNSYDLVYTWEVLHHVEDPQAVVKEMSRISKKYVVIFEPNRSNPMQFAFGALTKQERGTLRSTKSLMRKLCENAGMHIMALDFVGKIPPNKTPAFTMPVMSRLPFKSNLLTGISIAVIAVKPNHSVKKKKARVAKRGR